jgi:NAD(P)-dependent dehydrogenase (short-subunit alcohol dehydrogenase family)
MYTVNWALIEMMGIARGALSGKTALVTGAARGIGEATAMTLASLGAQVIIVDRLPQGQTVADNIQNGGGQAKFIQCDLSVVDDLMGMIPEAIAAFGKVDLLINNALHLSAAPIIGLSLDEWKTYATNAEPSGYQTASAGMLAQQVINVIALKGHHWRQLMRAKDGPALDGANSCARNRKSGRRFCIFFVPGLLTPTIRIRFTQSAAIWHIR